MKPIKNALSAEGTSSCRSLAESSRRQISTRFNLLAWAFVCVVLSELRSNGGCMAIEITVRYPPVIDAEGRDITDVQMLD